MDPNTMFSTTLVLFSSMKLLLNMILNVCFSPMLLKLKVIGSTVIVTFAGVGLTILVWRDAGKSYLSSSDFALNTETGGRSQNKGSNRGRLRSRKGRSRSRTLLHKVQCWNYNKMGHYRRNCRELKKQNNDSSNVVATENRDALLLSVDSLIDFLVLDLGASLHTIAHRKIIENYVAGNFGKVYLADGEALHIMGALVVARGVKKGKFYMTQSIRDTVAVATASCDANLWHQRLGYMSEKGMKVLLSKGKLPRMKLVQFDLCEGCVFGKQKKVSFLKNDRTLRSRKLKLVYTDLWGAAPVELLGRSRYYVSFIDDSSKKNEDKTFKEYGVVNGIMMEKTIPGTPQQNVSTAAYLINQGPSVPLNFILPEEVWSGKEVNLSFLKVFGYVSYVHIDSNAHNKLEAKSNKCFFIGYGNEEFGYRFWDAQNRNIVRSRNVIFNKQVMYKDHDRTKQVDFVPEVEKKDVVDLDELSEGFVPDSSQEDEEIIIPQER
ncbi:hypothetical protein RHSIM_Rhsim02G0128800 [Rhododendron simsii]|uniref:GAG-pre-integrase domain-containing protein n=1 Tax=Rhododendron simsii TaxID=118357 RepID=A0A834HN56_RHOSS|nr:hypothetical protein RHSIM_Rhsim02G0128800 [Rhododendron simsii]